MLRLTEAFLAALRSLVRSTPLIQRIFTIWYTRLVRERHAESQTVRKSLDTFTGDVEHLLGEILDPERLNELSVALQGQFKRALREDARCMLPSYNHQLPHGRERGTYLALDVGGSTFRVALVELQGPGKEMKMEAYKSYKINDAVKQLEGKAFFDWMAGKIEETISGRGGDGALSMGLAWSFPIEQTSLRSGLLQGMGKGFLASHGLLGEDLGDLIQQACSRRHLNVQLDAIVNDSSATLLSKAYTTPTPYGLILGTGVNIAVHLPVSIISPEKFGVRPPSWTAAATHVIINTELGMFGKGILPMTRWDVQLNAAHALPDFQPLEHLVGGRYLGEIARLILLDATQSTNAFDGVVPPSLERPYSLDTEVLANILSSPTSQAARSIFTTHHPSPKPPSDADMRFLTALAISISKRAAAILAAAIHALWSLRMESESPSQPPLSNPPAQLQAQDHLDKQQQQQQRDQQHVSRIAYDGSVIRFYPNFKDTCQTYLDTLLLRSGRKGALVLEHGAESSLFGAAVAVACGRGDDDSHHSGIDAGYNGTA